MMSSLPPTAPRSGGPSRRPPSGPASSRQDPAGWVLGHVGGAPVIVAPTSLVLGLVLAGSWYPLASSVMRSTTQVIGVVVGAVLGVSASILVHELAHGAVGTLVGRRPQRYVLNLLGGYTTFQVPSGERPWKDVLVSLAGPAANALIALVGRLVMGHAPVSDPVWVTLWAVTWMNIALAVFNVLPGLPLDGGHALASLVTQVTGRRQLGLKVAAWGGLVVVAGIVWRWILDPLVLHARRPDTFSVLIVVMLGWTIGSVCVRTLGLGRGQRAAARLDLRTLARPVDTVPSDAPLSVVREVLDGHGSLVLVVDGARLLGTIDAVGLEQAGLGRASEAMASPAHPVTAGQVCTVLPAAAVTGDLTGQGAAQAMARARTVSRWLLLVEDGRMSGAVPTGAR